MRWFWDALSAGRGGPQVADRHPAQCLARAVEGPARRLVITDENDVLRDEGEACARKLAQAGVTVTALRKVFAGK